MIDTVLVLTTFALTIVDIKINKNMVVGTYKLEAVFRIFRILLLMSKVALLHNSTK